MTIKNILVTNDDGITARGIHALAEALNGIANIYVCAPDRQRTAAGHGITVSESLFLKEEPFLEAKKAYSCSGTPADCVKLGLRTYRTLGIEMDMVCSGINHGANLGTDVLYSGTVSAALEGVLCGLPAIAFSCCSHEAVHLESFQRLAPQICLVAAERMDKNTVLNVNVPDVPISEIRGLKFTKLGAREYEDDFDPKEDHSGKIYYTYSANAVIYEDLPEGVDVGEFQKGYITITPLHYDLTNHHLVEEVASWGIQFDQADETKE